MAYICTSAATLSNTPDFTLTGIQNILYLGRTIGATKNIVSHVPAHTYTQAEGFYRVIVLLSFEKWIFNNNEFIKFHQSFLSSSKHFNLQTRRGSEVMWHDLCLSEDQRGVHISMNEQNKTHWKDISPSMPYLLIHWVKVFISFFFAFFHHYTRCT